MAPVTRPPVSTKQEGGPKWRPQDRDEPRFSEPGAEHHRRPGCTGDLQRHNKGAEAELWKRPDEGEGVQHARPRSGHRAGHAHDTRETLVQDGHEQLVREARQVLTGRVANDCRATIEQATGRRVVGWQTEVNPSADRAFTLIQLQPL
jgi:hypothetical protein